MGPRKKNGGIAATLGLQSEMFRRTAMDVTRWRLGDVAERPLGGRKWWDPPPDGLRSEPTPVLPIDRAITTLRHSKPGAASRAQRKFSMRASLHARRCGRYVTAMAVTPPPWWRAMILRTWRGAGARTSTRRARPCQHCRNRRAGARGEVPCTRWPLA